MASITNSARVLARNATRSSPFSASVRALSSQNKLAADASFESPFKGRTSKIPDFSNYRSKSSTNSNKVYQYFMVRAPTPKALLSFN